jgi:two-component system, LytTR family, response regulator
MRCIVVDDEPLAREGLEEYVLKVSFLELSGSFESALTATEILQENEINLMFLDIQMPHLTGIEFMKTLKNPPMVIFHTAYPNFALEGFQLDVMDYLVKPVSFERFYKAVSKAHEYFLLKNKAQDSPELSKVDYIFIKTDKRYEKVLLGDILYLEAMQNYTLIQTTKQKLLTLSSLKSFEESLPKQLFERVQKSYVVALDKIETFEGNQIKVGGKMIPLSRQQKEDLFARLVNRK